MLKYPDGRIERLHKQLTRHAVPADAVSAILAGGETISSSTPASTKAEWLIGAMERMDSLLDHDTRQAVREGCACCLGGKRLAMSRAIARDHATLEERIRAADRSPFVFGHSVTRQPDGRIMVRFGPEGPPTYDCPCIRKAPQPVSPTYCYCCGGHVKHHLQIALGRKLKCTFNSSVLASGGTQTCSFLFDILD